MVDMPDCNITIPWWQVDWGIEAVEASSKAVLVKNLSQGPITEELENKLSTVLRTRYAVATSSGSTALTLALMTAGARPGDVVLCPGYTWIATVNAAHTLGCQIELVDTLSDIPVMDVESAPKADNKRRFAIPVHMNGHACEINSLKNLGYTVIEDAAQALGSEINGEKLGTQGDRALFFFSIKNNRFKLSGC